MIDEALFVFRDAPSSSKQAVQVRPKHRASVI